MGSTSKKYELLFLLNAQLNGNFSNSFTRAQTEFKRLETEIQGVHRLQGNISSYQKQQKAVESTAGKLQNLQKQHDLLQKEIDETSGSTASLERQKLKLEQRIIDTESALERQQQKLSDTGERLQDAGIDTSNLSQESEKLTEKLKELQGQEEDVSEGADDAGGSMSDAFEAAAEAFAASGISDAFVNLSQGLMTCINLTGEFEETMSSVQAISGVNAEQLEMLSNLAKEMGATTKFTATEGAEALNYMGMAGWNDIQMMGGLSGIMHLAAASGEDLATTSDIVTDALTAFGLQAEDSAHFSDVLAQTSASANTNVSMMGESFKQVAPVAGALGYTVEDISLAIGLMANASIKGESAGTVLRNAISRLAAPTKKMVGLMDKYNISLTNMETGSLMTFRELLDDLRLKLGGIADKEEQAAVASTLFGKESMAGMLTLINAAESDYLKLADSINHCNGAAERMANVKLDNMNGQLTLAQSAWDALKMSIGEQFTPVMKKVYSVSADVFGLMANFVQQNPALVKGVTTAALAFGGVSTAIIGVSSAVKAFQALNLAAIFTGPVGAALGLAAAGAAVAGGIVAAVSATQEGIPSFNELTAATQNSENAMQDAQKTYQDTAAETRATAQVARGYIDTLVEIRREEDGNVKGSQKYNDVLNLLMQTIPELSELIDSETMSIKGGTDALYERTDAWEKSQERQGYKTYLDGLYQNYNGVLQEVRENEVKLTVAENGLKTAQENRANAMRRMQALQESGLSVDSPNYERNAEEYYNLENALRGYNQQIDDYGRQIPVLEKALSSSRDGAASAKEECDSAKEAIGELIGGMEEGEGVLSDTADSLEDTANAAEDLAERLEDIQKAYKEAYDAAVQSVEGQFGLLDKAPKLLNKSLKDFQAAWKSHGEYFSNYSDNIDILLERGKEIPELIPIIRQFDSTNIEHVTLAELLAHAETEAIYKTIEAFQYEVDEKRRLTDKLYGIAEERIDFEYGVTQEEKAMIEGADYSEEAYQSAANTMAGYVEGIESQAGNVDSAISGITQDAAGEMDISDETYQSGADALSGYAKGAQSQQGTVNQTFSSAGSQAVQSMRQGVSAAGPIQIPVYIQQHIFSHTSAEISEARNATAAKKFQNVSGAKAKPEKQHATGGILTVPHVGLVAEDGPEAIIPLSDRLRERGKELWLESGRLMGLLPNAYLPTRNLSQSIISPFGEVQIPTSVLLEQRERQAILSNSFHNLVENNSYLEQQFSSPTLIQDQAQQVFQSLYGSGPLDDAERSLVWPDLPAEQQPTFPLFSPALVENFPEFPALSQSETREKNTVLPSIFQSVLERRPMLLPDLQAPRPNLLERLERITEKTSSTTSSDALPAVNITVNVHLDGGTEPSQTVHAVEDYFQNGKFESTVLGIIQKAQVKKKRMAFSI